MTTHEAAAEERPDAQSLPPARIVGMSQHETGQQQEELDGQVPVSRHDGDALRLVGLHQVEEHDDKACKAAQGIENAKTARGLTLGGRHHLASTP